MNTYSLYDLSTGAIQRTLTCDADMLAINVSEGLGFIEGSVDGAYVQGGVFVAIPSQPSPSHTWHWPTKTWIDPRTLQDFKDAQWAQIRSERDTRETAGFPYAGKMIDSDSRSVQRINTAVQAAQAAYAAGAPFTLFWTTQDNSTLWLDVTGMMGMPVALAQYANSLHETARALRAQIDAATTPEAVEEIQWPI